jgi:hypothetical protein
MPFLRLVSRGLRPAAPLLLPLLLMSLLPAKPLALSRAASYAPHHLPAAPAGQAPAASATRAGGEDGSRGEAALGASSGSEATEGEEGEASAEGVETVAVSAAGESASSEAEGEEAEIEVEEGTTGAPAGRKAHAGRLVARLSGLRLARASAAALAHHAVPASKIRFTFSLSTAAKVHVTLARAVSQKGRVHWRGMADSLTLAAPGGRNRGRLRAANMLVAGRYRLTLRASRGGSRSIIIHVK